jgi:hypothetical protein
LFDNAKPAFVPEPATVLLLGTLLLGVVPLARKRLNRRTS